MKKNTAQRAIANAPKTYARFLLAGLMLISGSAFAATADLVVNQLDTPDPGPAGGIFTYTIRTDNNGPGTATGITLTDALPAGSAFVDVTTSAGNCSHTGGTVTCNLPDMLALETITTIVRVRLPTAGVYANMVSVTSTSTDPVPGNNLNIEERTSVIAAADLEMVSSVSSANVVAGQAYSYDLEIVNHGPDDVQSGGQIHATFFVPAGASITADPSGNGWACVPDSGYPLSSGTSITCSAPALANGATSNTLTIPAVANIDGSIASAFTASATKPNGDLMPDGNNDNDTDNVAVAASPGSDVAITKTGTPNPVALNEEITFTLTPRFNGGIAPGSSGGDIVVTDTLGAGLTYVPGSVNGSNYWDCSVVGQVITCTRDEYTGGNHTNMPQITLRAIATDSGTLENTADISIPETDPYPGNNSTSINISSSNSADLSVSKTASLNPVVPGQDFNYNIRVRNHGLLAVAAGQTIKVTDSIPAGVSVTAAPTGPGWSCASSVTLPASGPLDITCTRSGPLARNANTPLITIPVQLNAAGAVTNTASVDLSGDGPVDENSNNDTGNVVVTASVTEADLQITKSASGTVDAGEDLTYTITVTNNGPAESTNVIMTDRLTGLINNGGLQSITAPAGASCSPSTLPANGTSQNVSCNLGTLTNGQSAIVTITVRPSIATTGNRRNTALVSSEDIGDPDRSNNSAVADSEVTAVVDLVVSKSGTPNPVPANAPLTYIATVRNDGPSTAQAVELTDILPAGATFIDLQNVSDNGVCPTIPAAGDSGGTLACGWNSIPAGSQRTVTYRVRPAESAIGTSLENAVSVTTTTRESNEDNNSYTELTPVVEVELDVLINKTDSSDPIALGENTTYTVTVTNTGPSMATGIEMTDIFPDPNQTPTAVFSYQGNLVADMNGTCTEPAIGATSGIIVCSFPQLDEGETATITYEKQAESLTEPGALSGTAYNYASVTVNEVEITTENNWTDESTTTRREEIITDLSIIKTLIMPASGPLFPGEEAVYEIIVTNHGPETSEGGQMIDELPAGLTFVSAPGCVLDQSTVLCGLGTLAEGDTQSFTITTMVDEDVSEGAQIVNIARVDAPGDTDPGNNESTTTDYVFVSTAIPTLSEWALLLMAALLGMAGFFSCRRRVS